MTKIRWRLACSPATARIGSPSIDTYGVEVSDSSQDHTEL